MVKNKNKKSYGFTTVEKDVNFLTITHNGNMGNSIERSVNSNLKELGYKSIEELKNMYNCILESGSPDYMYKIKFKI